MEEKEMKSKKKGLSGIEKFFYMVFLPLLALVVLGGMLLAYNGYPVLAKTLEYGNKVPYLNAILPDPEREPEAIVLDRENADLRRQLTNALDDLSKKEKEVEKLSKEQEEKDAKLEELESVFDEIKAEQESQKLSDEDFMNKMKEMSDLYAGMSAGKAAPILEKMSLEETALILSGMKNDKRQAIMSKMEPDYAANLTVVLQNTELSKDAVVFALQERVKTLMESMDDTSDSKSNITVTETAKTIANMPPQQGAALIIDMGNSATDFYSAVKILANMDESSRSAILAEVTKTDSVLAKRIINSITN